MHKMKNKQKIKWGIVNFEAFHWIILLCANFLFMKRELKLLDKKKSQLIMQKKDMIYIQKQNYNIWRDIKKKNDFFSSQNNLFVNLKRHKKNGESFIYIV